MKVKLNPSLTNKQRKMLEEYITDPKITKKQAYLKAYNINDDTTEDSLTSQVTQAFGKPLVKNELAKFNGIIEDTLINTVVEYKDSEKQWQRVLANDNAKYVHDKIHGRAKQQMDITSTSITLNIDLSGDGTTKLPHSEDV